MENSGLEVFSHSFNSPNLTPSDYHLLGSMQNHLNGERIASVDGVKNELFRS